MHAATSAGCGKQAVMCACTSAGWMDGAAKPLPLRACVRASSALSGIPTTWHRAGAVHASIEPRSHSAQCTVQAAADVGKVSAGSRRVRGSLAACCNAGLYKHRPDQVPPRDLPAGSHTEVRHASCTSIQAGRQACAFRMVHAYAGMRCTAPHLLARLGQLGAGWPRLHLLNLKAVSVPPAHRQQHASRYKCRLRPIGRMQHGRGKKAGPHARYNMGREDRPGSPMNARPPSSKRDMCSQSPWH